MLPPRVISKAGPRLNQLSQQVSSKASTSLPVNSPLFATMTDQSKWKFNHTMLRVKDPLRSVEYYKLLGYNLINKIEQKEAKFDLYFLGDRP